MMSAKSTKEAMLHIPSEMLQSIDTFVGFLTAEAVREGFQKEIGSQTFKYSIGQIQSLGKMVLARLPWSKDEAAKKLAAAQEPMELEIVDAEVRTVLKDAVLMAEVKSLMAEIKAGLERAAPVGVQTNNTGGVNPQFNAPVETVNFFYPDQPA
jgi:hypothetical protein